jgi:hypothetical protein
MVRILFAAALLYGCGDHRFDGRRPHALDRPLRDFHRAVDAAVGDVHRTLALLDDARSMRYLAPLTRALDRAL